MTTLKRILGALRLNENALYEIGFDRRETGPAVILFCLATLGAGYPWLQNNSSWLVILLAWVISSVLALGLLGEVARFSALLLFGGGVRRDEVVRLAGFSMLPLVLSGLPYLGIPMLVWSLVILFSGLRAYYALGTGRTVTLLVFSAGAAFVFWALANAIVVAITQPG